MSNSPRDLRLRTDHDKLREISANSDFITAVPVDVLPGRPPEKWEVTYTCRGITGIRRDGTPVYGQHHKVRVELTREYPNKPPRLHWMTPIWHPNIQSEHPHMVCIDQANWQTGFTLDRVVLMMGEMVQYKNYHADSRTPPYPLDAKVAAWAVEAERAGLFSKRKPVDARPLLRPDAGAGAGAVPAARSRVKFRTAPTTAATAPTANPAARPRVRFTSRESS